MESRANYTAVGGYVLGFIVFLTAFIVWVTGVGFHESTKTIHVIFARVSGLKEGSQVRYQGVPIGRVEKIDINPKNPQQILVATSIEKKVPVKRDVQASLEIQPLTGTAWIQLSGGTPEAPEIRKEKGYEHPTIYGHTSQLDKAIENAPEVLEDIKNVVSEENREALRDILSNVKEFTGNLKEGKEGGESAGEGGGITGTISAIKAAAQEFSKTSQAIRSILEQNQGGLNTFASSGLASLSKLIEETREMVATFKRIGEAIERSPGRFLHNDPDKGVRLK